MNQDFFLFKEGDAGNFFYIVKEGELELINNYGERKIIRKGESFGELALIQKNLRSCTIKSLSDVEVYCLQGDLFKEIVLKMNNLDLKERISFLSENAIFRYLDANQLHDIARKMLKCEFDKGESICDSNIKDSLYIVKQGVISLAPNNNCNIDNNSNNKIKNSDVSRSILYKCNQEIKCSNSHTDRENSINRNNHIKINEDHLNNNEKIKFREKEFFGLSALLFGESNFENIMSETYSKCYQITKGLMVDILGKDYSDKILQVICKGALTRVKMIKILSADEYFPKVFSLLKFKKYFKDDVVFSSENYINKKIIFIVEGAIKNVI